MVFVLFQNLPGCKSDDQEKHKGSLTPLPHIDKNNNPSEMKIYSLHTLQPDLTCGSGPLQSMLVCAEKQHGVAII